MKTPKVQNTQTGSVSQSRENALAIVRKTEHVGKRYSDGAPNDCKPSTVAGMMNVLDVMLSYYKGDAE